MVARGATITHAKTAWLNCLIPFPNQKDAERVIHYVSVLMQAIVEKEKAIRQKNALIDSIIETELMEGQKSATVSPAKRQASVTSSFVYELPTISEIRSLKRLDASMYSEDVKRKLFLITNYKYGFETYDQMGFEIGRGQNLQISCIGKSIYSDDEKPNFYRLVAPTDISEYRTVRQFRYLGNKKALSLLKRGDVIFGAEGFCKGRVVILADGVFLTITNIHGIVFHHKDDNIVNGIFLGCFLGYLRNIGLIDAIGAGGSGGSLAIGYFHHVPFPKFPDEKKTEIARLYHNPAPSPKGSPTLDTFVEWHRNWNEDLGIWELDYEMKALQQTLEAVQKNIISGETISLPFYLETSLSHRPRSVRDFETQLLLPLTSTSH
jgi:type I restriction enzyme S subunit